MKKRGFTLTELMVTMTVMALVFSLVLDIWHVSAVNQKQLLTKAVSFTGTTSVLNTIAKEARNAIRFETRYSLSGKPLYTFVLPADADSNGNFAPVRTAKGLVYREGMQVQYYLSDITGSPTASGQYLWRATAPAGSLIFTPDTSWSRRDATHSRYDLLSSFQISAADLWGTQVSVDARIAATEATRTSDYTGRSLVALTNNNGMQVEFPLDSRATFYLTNQDPSAQSPKIIDLQSLNVQAGDKIRLEILGHFSYWNNSNPATDVSAETCFIFSATDTVLDSSVRVRIPDAVACDALPYTSTTTWIGNLPTDIDYDFGTSGSMEITVPAGARYLMACTFDGYYGDNQDLDHDYRLRITKL